MVIIPIVVVSWMSFLLRNLFTKGLPCSIKWRLLMMTTWTQWHKGNSYEQNLVFQLFWWMLFQTDTVVPTWITNLYPMTFPGRFQLPTAAVCVCSELKTTWISVEGRGKVVGKTADGRGRIFDVHDSHPYDWDDDFCCHRQSCKGDSYPGLLEP